MLFTEDAIQNMHEDLLEVRDAQKQMQKELSQNTAEKLTDVRDMVRENCSSLKRLHKG